MSLFDILSSIEDGQFLCSFTWPRGISRLESINRWVDECKQALVRIANSPLPSLATLSEYPLIPHGYAPLDSFVGKFLEQWKLNSLEEIETILPCSPIQEGIIASQVKDSNLGLYDFESVWKVSSETGTPVNLDQFESALREVVGRHQILRTVFCESEFARMPFVQVVLRDAESICRTVFRVACNSVNDIDTAVTHPGLLVPGQFPYSFTIYETAQGVYCKSNMNHALVDGASMAVLLRDIYLAYDRLELPPAPLYGDFIAYLQNRDDEESYAFWKSMLEDVDPCHFPSLNKTQRAEFRSVDVPVADGVRLREFCRSQNVTMATLMSTVWSLVLQSYLGKDTSTVCFGFLAAGRDVPVAGVQDIMGPLFAMLVQMVSLDLSTAVTDLLGQVQNKIAESLSHQHCSLSRIQNSIGLNGTKLFNTVLNLQRRDRLQNRPSIKIESEAVYDPSEFDISFNIVDADDGVSANLQFWTSCLSEEHALNVSRAIDQAIRAVLENPAKSVGSLSLFHEHHATQLRQWNSSVPASIISCVHRMVEEQVDDQPGALAVCTTAAGGNTRLTYRELDDLAAKLASHLASLGVGPGTFVPFCHEKSPWTIVVMYAILKAGGACVALDPSHPPRRLQEIINMTEAKVVVSQKKHAEKFDGLAKVVEIAPGTWDSLPPLPFRGSATPRDAAFVTFTSGSTGEMEVNWAHLTPTVAGLLNPVELSCLETIVLGGEAIPYNTIAQWLGHTRVIATYGPAECSITCSGVEVHEPDGGLMGLPAGANLWIVAPQDHNKLVPIGSPGEILIEAWAKDFPIPGVPETGRRMYKSGDMARFNLDGSISSAGRKDMQVKIHGQRVDLREIEHHIAKTGATRHAAALILQKGHLAGRLVLVFSPLDAATENDDVGAELDLGPLILQRNDVSFRHTSELRSLLEERVPGYMLPRAWICVNALPVTANGKLDRKQTQRWLETLSDETYEKIMAAESTGSSAAEPDNPVEKELRKAWSRVLGVPEKQIGTNQSFFSLAGDSISAIQVSSILRNAGIQISVQDILQFRSIQEIAKHTSMVHKSLTNATHATVLPAFGDFPLLRGLVDYSGLETITRNSLSELKENISQIDEIDDIYPCSPMQEGILASRARQQGLYDTQETWKVTPRVKSSPVDLHRLQKAVCMVISRHPLLRTYFVEGTALLPYVQVVLKKVPNPVDIVACKDLAELLALSSYSKDVAEKMFTYRFTIAETPKGEVFCKLEMNHALIDGISMKILVRDIVLAYDSPDTPTAGPLYSEFIRYLQQKQPEETAIAYWANLLGDVDPCLFPSLAVDAPEAPKVFNARDLFLSSAHVKRVHEFCQNNSTTVANFMSAVWALVLQAYTGSSTVCFGYLSSGRDAPVTDADAIVGPLINMMIRKVDLDGQLPVPELIETMHTNFLQGFSHQHCSLAKVHHVLDRERRRGQLFNTVVNVQRLASPGSDQSAIEFEVVHGHDPSEYDITFNVVDSDREIFFSLQYWTSCLSDEHAELLRSTLLRAVESLIDNAAGTLASIDLFSDHHKAKVLEWNSNVPQTVASCIQELVERRVQSQPNAQAVSSSSTVLTYKELDDLASKLAGHLALLGVGPETMVPFYFEKSAWGVVTTYAILKAGGACVALSPEYPRNRVASIIESTRATIAVADATLAPRLADLVDKVVVIDASKGGLASMKEQLEDLPISQPVRASPENPCFITFTSGSTGTPKGIVIEHASLCTSIHHHGTVELLAATSRVLQFASYIFDVSVEEMFTTLSFGGCVCVPTEQERMNDLATFIQSQNIDWAHLTPTVASLLDPEMVPGLKTLVLGGELIPKNIVEKWVNRTQLIATYGPAECSITCTGAPISPSQVRGGQMGLPAGALIWIADPKDPNKLAPIGCPGEIMIEGPLLARGYLDPVQTAAAFLVDLRWTQDVPVNGVPSTGRRVYKAGDMARYSLDGSIISGGRKDTQVKIRGQRVDLREIEHHLEGEDVRHAAALIPSTGYWKEKIIAVFSLWDLPVGKKPENLQVMAAKEIVPYINKFRSALQDNVPGYMMPAAWIAVETLPLTTNGKMNRRQVQGWLETMDPELCKTVLSLERRGDASGPRRELNEMEKELVTIWAAVLDIEESRIGLDQAFFSLGGDSISAMQVTSRLRAAGIRLPVHDILRYRTIAALATRATYTEERQTSVAAQTMTNRVESIDTDFGLTPIQQMHFQIHKSGQNHYNQSILIKLRERSNANVVHEALLALVARHPMLRARFRVNSQGVWAQRITTETSESCRFTSFSASSLEESIPMLSRSQTSLDIINGPLMAADLVQTDEQQYLYIVIHHLAIDLVSWGIIFREMEALLSGKLDSPQPLSFQTWALAQADYALENLAPRGVLPSGGLIKPDFEYWNMTDTQNAYGSSTGATFSIDRESTRLILGDANTAMHTEPVEIILAVIITSFQRIFRDRNVPPVFLEGHGRESWLEDIDISKTIGWFTTMYPIQVSGAKTVAAPTHDNQLTDLERILREVKDVRHGIETFQGQERMEILFNYLGGQQGTDLGSGLFGKSAFKFPDLFDVDPSASRAALFEISAGVEDGELRYSINYSSNIGRQDQIRAWIRECELLLASACKKLAKAPVIPTLVDYPLLQLDDYEPLDSIVENCVVRLGLPGAENIESIHPCSPMQEGILFSRSRTDSLYDVQVLLQVTSRGGQVVDLHRFQQACEQLIAHHQALRTHFIEAAGEQENLRSFLQVVEKHVTNPPILLCKYDSLDQFSASSPPATHETGKLPYRFTICEVPSRDARPGEIYLRIEINHALIDGTSTGILVRDLMRSYDGELRGLVGPAYSDFIAYLQAQPPNEAIDFWTAYLSGVTKCQFPVLVDEVKPGTDKTASENAGQTHPAQSEQLHSFCKSYNTTLANLMSAVWAIVLQCFVGTSSEDPSVCFGYLNSGRDIPIEGVHDLIGPLITILARRAQVYPSMRVIDLVEKMQDDFARSLPHQHCSLAEIHHALGLGASPLFNTTVNLQKKDRGLGGLTQGSIVLEEVMGYDPSEYDISLGILDGDHVQLSLTYWDHCLSEFHARSLSRSVSATLASILSDPNRRIADINLVSAHDLALYHTWNADSEYEVSGYIHNAIKRQVDLQPEAPAICSTEPAVTVSYRDLDRLSDHLAKSPPLHDIEAGAFVLLCFDKSPWTPLVMLAVLKAGGACVAVDPSLSADHLEGIIEDTKSSVVLATPFHAHLFATKVAHVIEIDGEKLTSQLQAQGAEGRYESADDGVPLHPKLGGVDRPAFVIFNSSGTEKPEGVVVNHSTYCTSVAAHAPILRMQRGTRVLQFASYMEDTSAREIYTTLMVGGCVCVPSESQLRDQLAASIQAMHVNYLSLTPTVAAALQPTSVPTVQTLVVSGEVINRGVLASWADSVSLITTYGPAGTAGWTTANVGIKSTAYPANLGQTKLGNSLWITDPRDSNKLLPIGALGEIVVGGPAFAHRYLSTEPKADSAFVEPPAWYNLSKRSNGIEFFYRSGDLGRYNPDGSVTLVGRKSDRSGQLDDLEQVCQQLVALPGIEHAAVLLPQSGVLGRRLVAVLSLRDVSLNLQQPEALRPVESRFHELAFKSLGPVRSEAELVLPMQKVPTEWIVVEKIPLLSSGRLDTPAVRTWLEKMTQEEYQTAIAVLAHGNSIDTLGETNLSPLEIELRSVFAQVLKQDSDTLSTSRTFIGLGGDSISAMQVVWHARARGINIFVQDVMRMGSISKIAVRAAEAGPIPGKGSRQKSSGDPFALLQVPTSRLETLLRELTLSQRGLVAHTKDIEDIFPCSPVQEGILISQAKSPSQYKVRAMWKVTTSHPGETVVVDRLVEAWNKAAARHQALRSFFIEEGFGNASFAQVVLKEAAVPVLQLDYDTLEDFMAAQQADTYPDGNLPYQVTIGRLSSGDVYCKLVISHALDDGFSRQVVLRDVAAAYDNTLSTEKAPAYSDYIAYISRQPAEAASTYWKNYLSDVSPCHFPVLNQEVQGQSLELPIVRRVIDQEQTAALQLLCVEQEVTISDVFKVIWAVVLRAYLGGEPVAFGYLTSGRDAPIDNVHGIAGPLINMLVYRTEGNAGATFADLLKEAHNDYAQSLPHQYAPLKEVLHVAGAGQDGLFNTVVNVMSLKFQGEAWNSKIAFEPRPVYDPTEYSVSLDVVESKSEIELFLDYWPSYLSPEQAAGIMETVLKAIGCLLDNPSQTLGQLDLFSKRDQLQVSRWGAIPDYGDSECLHHVIERRAAAQPDAPAVASDDGGLSYKELNEFANVLAHHLVDLGAGPEKFIPLCFEKSPWGVVAMVAVLKAGAACVGLDPAQPLERMETIISDTNASLVLASTANAGRLKNRDVEVVLVNSSTLASLPRRATAPKTAVTVDNAAYIVYTSGSTGTPKGAILEHRNLYAMSLSLPKLGMTAHSRVGHFASYAFDVSIEETILTLMQGACSCVISDEDRLGDLAGAMNRLQVTWSELTPTVVRMLEPRDLPHLETLIVGGEVLPDDIIAKWSSQVSLVNTYGPCECSITCSMTDVLGTGTRGVNIGGPLMANFWITDIHNSERLVPVGAIGELVIEGPLVGRGYLNNKEKTRESFLQNPAWSHDSGLGHRFYKTGDLARWNLDGTVTYLGRKDSQAKIHGQRIELTEIEHHISEDGLPIIENAEQRSWAWDQLANIRQIVEIKLPRHMVPTLWIPVIRLPLLASGKTNRRLIARWLEEMDHGTHVQMIGPSQEQEAIVPPSTEMEIILRDLWAELLHTAPGSIGIDQNFFGIGGDSVLAMRLISLLRSRGVGVTAGDIFQKKTIAKIALGCRRRLVDHNRAETAGGALANDAGARNNLGKMRFRGPEGIVAAGIEDSYPCSPMQESILEAQEQNKNGWYSQWIYELGSPHTGRPVNLNNVADAWQKTVARHQILRTLFFRPPTLLGEKPERYQQIVLKSFEAPVVYINADAEDPATIFEMAPDIPSANVPPHRVILASTPSGKTFAQFQLSHTLYDAVSLSVLWHDLQLLYTSDAGTELPRAPPYRAFIDYLEGAGRSEAESFWRGRLARLEPCNFPVIAPLSSRSSSSSAFKSLAVPFTAGSNVLRSFCRTKGITTGNLFQAAWALVLRHFTGRDDLCFGYMLSGRDAPIEDAGYMLGPFINLMPCRVDLSPTRSLASVLSTLQEGLADILTNQNCSLEDITAAIGAATPLYNTFLNMQRVAAQEALQETALTMKELGGFMADEYAISVYVVEHGEEVSISMNYWTHVLSEEQAAQVARAVDAALSLIFERSGKTLGGCRLNLELEGL
ncbi:non-ribosomal peptide synthetase [Thozetella sp. PMI_491]|nr:non-ribosomal peptide synthetase [Thozetella sp. PMI_491]